MTGTSDSPAVAALDRVTAHLSTGETRDGQRRMVVAVEDAVAHGRHLIVQAGTGTGKSLAYLVPTILSGRRVVVVTATKALQDQLAHKDLPFLATELDHDVSFAVLKGRSNYVCRQRLRELDEAERQGELDLDDLGARASATELAGLANWAATSPSGDRAELTLEPTPSAWAAVSVSAQECPGASRCPSGASCFAEAARNAALEAQVVVVNQHLYGLHVASGGELLPEHDVVVIDEAHQLVDVVSATSGLTLSSSRFTAVARAVAAILEDPPVLAGIEALARDLDDRLLEDVGRRLQGGIGPDLSDLIALALTRLGDVGAALRAIDPGGNDDVATRRDRAVKLTGSLVEDLQFLTQPPTTSVLWVEGPDERPSLRLAPLDVAPLLHDGPWADTTAILTSATIPPGLADSVGLDAGDVDIMDVGSPFDHAHRSLLYCAKHLPEPRSPDFDDMMHDELERLIRAAGGATLALFTSFRAMDAAVAELRERLEFPILSQRDRPKPALVEAFRDDQATCLFATMSFWQGVDVPGATLSLVTIDRLPFPRPDEPLLQARRDHLRENAFRSIDLPRAATMLAQGAGRLIRSSTDRGVVAVFDPRLATKRSYRWALIEALPPMPRTASIDEAEAFLRSPA